MEVTIYVLKAVRQGQLQALISNPDQSLTPNMLPWQDVTAIVVAFALWRFLVVFTRRSVLDDIKGPPGAKFVEGHMGSIFDIKHGLDYGERLSDEYGDVLKLRAMGSDVLWISDPRALEHMLLKAPAAWDASPLSTNLSHLLFGPGLLASSGGHHKKQRRLLNPMFSGNQMSNMVPLFYKIGHQLKGKLLEQFVGTGTKELDILDWMSRTTLEFVGQGSLGYEFDALEGRQDEYRDILQQLSPSMARLGIFDEIAAMFHGIGPAWFLRFIVNIIPLPPAVQEFKHIVDTMHKLSTRFFQRRKLLVEQDGVDVSGQEDLLSLLVRLNSHPNAEDRLSDQEAIAQLNTVVFAANDTTSGALCRVFELLASHPDIQIKLREELEHANADSGLDYDQLMSLPLLDAVCKETLRLHPPVPISSRCCQQDDVIPLQHPIKSKTGHTLTEVIIPKGAIAFIGISVVNRSKSIWGSNAREWIPERWLTSSPVTKTRLPGAFSSMMTFMGGERSCIGFRMAFLELKIVLSVLLLAFRFELSSEDVVWHLGATLAPFVQGKDGAPDRGPKMPMRLSRLGSS